MSLSDRVFAPPEADAKKAEERQAKLPLRVRELLQQARDALAQGQLDVAQGAIVSALGIVPGQPDALCLHALVCDSLGRFAVAAAKFEQALIAAPDDALTYYHYARLREQVGDIEGSYALRRLAAERIPDSPLAWSDLAEHLFAHVSVDAALAPLAKAVELGPNYAPAWLKFGTALVNCGRVDQGVAAMRRALQLEPAFGAAWASLADVKTASFTLNEVAQLRELLQGSEPDESERIAIEFALAKAYENMGCYREAYDLLCDGNARKRRELEWSSAGFAAKMARIAEVSRRACAVAPDAKLGERAIFIVGLPRSGTTLIEQIFASHSQVEGAGELGDLGAVLAEESMRRKLNYPEWMPQATPEDWQRLGQRYLGLTAHWRDRRPYFTDKALTHWMGLGAIRAMLPGARIVVCRRDPLENCWSCFRQLFSKGWEFTYNFEEVAEYWKVFDKEVTWWIRHAPHRILEQSYEALLDDPEAEISKLIGFLGLPFEENCLNFYQTKRTVKTLSAAQVRQPLRKDTARAVHYGALLNPLRLALGMPPLGAK